MTDNELGPSHVRIAERACSLPDLDPSWTNPDWSRSQYLLSAPTPTDSEREPAVSETNGIEVKAFMRGNIQRYIQPQSDVRCRTVSE